MVVGSGSCLNPHENQKGVLFSPGFRITPNQPHVFFLAPEACLPQTATPTLVPTYWKIYAPEVRFLFFSSPKANRMVSEVRNGTRALKFGGTDRARYKRHLWVPVPSTLKPL